MRKKTAFVICWYQLRDGTLKSFRQIFCKNCDGYDPSYKDKIICYWSIHFDEYSKLIQKKIVNG